MATLETLELFTQALKIPGPWFIENIQFKEEKKES